MDLRASLRPALVALLVAALAGGLAIGAGACGDSPGKTAGSTDRASAGPAALGPLGDPVPGAATVHVDLPYATESSAQRLDIYLPAGGEAPYPVLVAIHGGGFSGGDKEDGQVTPVLRGLTRGYAVVGLDYRLSGEARFPAAVNDVKTAVRWLRAHAAEYGLDGSRVALWGDSAGGNLAALAGTAGDSTALRGPHPANAGQSDQVQAVVDWFGPISFLQTDRDFRVAGFERPSAANPGSFLSEYLGASLDQVPGRVRASDPITYLSPEDPPILIEHGKADGTVPYPQSVRLARAYAAVAGGDKVTLHLYEGAGHVDPLFYEEGHLDDVLDWLDARLGT